MIFRNYQCLKSILPILAAWLFPSLASVHGQQRSVAECTERMLTHVRQLPDCEFKYTVSRWDRPERPVVIKYQGDRIESKLYHFSHYKGRFFIKTFVRQFGFMPYDKPPEVEEWLAYDGTTYYRFKGDTLICGKNFEDSQIKVPFTAGFADHPVFAIYHDSIFAGKGSNFALPFLNEEQTWTDALAGAESIPPVLPEYLASIKMNLPGQSRVFHFTALDPFPIECVANHRFEPAGKIVTSVRLGNEFVTGPHSRYPITESIVRNITGADGKTSELDRIGVAMASFKLISTDPGPDVYQIPRHLAKTVIDLDAPQSATPAYDLLFGARFAGMGALQHLTSTVVGIATLTEGAGPGFAKSMRFMHAGSRTSSKADLDNILRRGGASVKGLVRFEVVATEPSLEHSRSRMGSTSYLKTEFNLRVTSDTSGELDMDALFPELKLGIRAIDPDHPVTATVRRSIYAGRPPTRKSAIALTIAEEGSNLWTIDERGPVDDAQSLLVLTRNRADSSSAVLYRTSKIDRGEVPPDIVDQLAKAVISRGSQFYIHRARGRSGTGITVHRVVPDEASGALERRPATKEELMQLDMPDANTSPVPDGPTPGSR